MGKSTERIRSKNLTDTDIGSIVEILDGWTGRLTWSLLLEVIEKRLKASYTRQTLHQHERIRLAFGVAKKRFAGEGEGLDLCGLSPVEAKVFSDRYERLTAEVQRLRLENERWLEQFVVWAYNAHTRGLDEEFLNRPIPAVNRSQTRKTKTR